MFYTSRESNPKQFHSAGQLRNGACQYKTAVIVNVYIYQLMFVLLHLYSNKCSSLVLFGNEYGMTDLILANTGYDSSFIVFWDGR